MPFSNASSGALTTSTSRLKLDGVESYSAGEFLEQSKSFLIDSIMKFINEY